MYIVKEYIDSKLIRRKKLINKKLKSSMMMTSSVSEEQILDISARIGVQARCERLAKAQLENLLASLDLVEDPKASLLVAAAYAHRQAARLGRGYVTARLVSNALNQIYKSGGKKENARKILGLAKWVFEAIENTGLPKSPSEISSLTFTRLIELLGR